MVESNNNLVGYADRARHYECFMKEGFVLPKGGVKAGLKGQLVILKKTITDHDDENEEKEENAKEEIHINGVSEENGEKEQNEELEEYEECGEGEEEDDEYEY